VSRAAVSEITERLWEEYEASRAAIYRSSTLSTCLSMTLLSGCAPAARASRSSPLGDRADGQKVLLHLMSGSKEDTETVRAFFQDMRARGLGDPILVASDGAPGIIRAIEECFPPARPGSAAWRTGCAISQ
jgi:hypothetical protein